MTDFELIPEQNVKSEPFFKTEEEYQEFRRTFCDAMKSQLDKDTPPLNETQIRLLRNVVFDQEISNEEWTMCGKRWMREDSVKWLQEHQRAILI